MIRKSVISVLLLIAVLVSQNAHALYRDDVILLDQTVSSGQAVKHFARSTLKTGNVFSVANGGSAELRAGNSIELRPGFNVQPGGTFLAQKGWAYDTTGPVLLAPNDSVELFFQGTGDLILLFADAESEIYSVTLRDHTGTDITSQAEVTDNTLSLPMLGYSDGIYNFTLLLEDMAGNISESAVDFTVDSIPPTTTVSIPGGMFTESQAVFFTCSEDVKIYYSTDGYPPYPSAENTTSLQVISGIANDSVLIEKFTLLQFFAVDDAGNREETKKEVYYFDQQPDSVTGLDFTTESASVLVYWNTPSIPTNGFRVFRAHSPFEIKMLQDSITGNYPPPERLFLSQVSTPSYNDSTIITNIDYWYGVTLIDEHGAESAMSEFKSIRVKDRNGSASKEEAVGRGLAWLEANQSEEGFWGDKKELRMLVTCQVLTALATAGKDSAGIRQGLYWLRGHRADNNDYLARKILTLNNYGQNVDNLIHRLISQAQIEDNQIKGWGAQKAFTFDALSTALGASALERTLKNLAFANKSYHTLLSDDNIKNDHGYYDWLSQSGNLFSYFVSSLVYDVLGIPDSFYQWILSGELEHTGSLNASVLDTSAALCWLNLPQGVTENVETFW